MSDEIKLTKKQWLELERLLIFQMQEDEAFEECFGPPGEYDATVSTPYGSFHAGKLWLAWKKSKDEEVESRPEPVKGRGGRREGAGRPRREKEAATEKKTIRMTPQELLESLELLEEGEAWSEMVRRLLRRSVTIERELKRRRQLQGGQEET